MLVADQEGKQFLKQTNNSKEMTVTSVFCDHVTMKMESESHLNNSDDVIKFQFENFSLHSLILPSFMTICLSPPPPPPPHHSRFFFLSSKKTRTTYKDAWSSRKMTNCSEFLLLQHLQTQKKITIYEVCSSAN